MTNFNIFLYVLIIILPLFASLTAGFLGRKLGDKGVHFITCSSLILSSILISYAFYEVGIKSNPQYIVFAPWISCEFLLVKWELLFDQLSVSLGVAVIWCSTLIHIYSIDYLSSDPHNQRFFSFLSAFTAGMLILIFGGNYFVMFVGWEMIGVVSYLLINFYFTRIQANKAALLAFIMNRVGDMLLSISFFSLFNIFGSVNFSTVFSLAPLVNEQALVVTGFLFLGGALAKSANIPFQSWLPGSMEAPTPVSALLHAATLVTAGVYLLLRSSPVLEYTPTVLLTITIIGSTTALYGATSGLLQNDLKRIIAMSTISQLGYMFMAIGLSQYNVALFHTVNHAFFKALLFLGAGAVIHSFNDQQDVRKMGGLIKFMPFIYSVMLVGTLSLMALPFLTGFYSKDLILELAYSKYSFSGIYAYILGSITAGITAFYSFRLISLVFLQIPNGQKQSYLNAHESNWFVIIPLLVLSFFSIFFGYVMSDLFTGPGSDFFSNSLFLLPENTSIIEAELLSLDTFFRENTDSLYVSSQNLVASNIVMENNNLIIKLIPSILSVGGALLALFIYNNKHYFKLLTPYSFSHPYSILIKKWSKVEGESHNPALSSYNLKYAKGQPSVWSFGQEAHSPYLPLNIVGTHPITTSYAVTKNNSVLKKLYSFFNGKYYFDIVYNNFIVSKGFNFSYIVSKEIDRGIIEFLGPNGLSNVAYNIGKNISKLDTGIITTYALYITISLLFFTFLFFLSPYSLEYNQEILLNKNVNFDFYQNTTEKTEGLLNLIKFNSNIEVFKFITIIAFCLILIPKLPVSIKTKSV